MHKKVSNYYRANFSQLSFVKQYHFASRLWLWCQDKEMEQFLQNSRAKFYGDGTPKGFNEIIKTTLNDKNTFGAKNAIRERAPFFAKYPLLRPTLRILFRMLFTETVYGINMRSELEKHISLKSIDDMEKALLHDETAVAILSTHAINFFYLWNRFYKCHDDGIPIETLFEIGESHYDASNKTGLLLLVYLYTHCIIGETLFYKRLLPSSKKLFYQQKAKELEERVAERYFDINLDNKFEFLVCQEICGRSSVLKPVIYSEAGCSFSDVGDFIIDQFNQNPQLESRDFEESEHRNVLFLMSNMKFTPTSRVLT